MDGLSALLAGLIASLRGVLGTDACPGGWPWAVSALGVGVGLLPTLGLIGVAVLRRRIGSRYGVSESALLIGLGVLSAGLLPLLAFTATGRIFTLASAGRDVPGLTNRQLRDLSEAACLDLPQSDYLGEYSVTEAFSLAVPLRFGLALLLLVLFPLVAASMVAVQARLALRRGPRWPSRFFWLPLLAVAVLTVDVAAGSSGQLWVGVTIGGFLGIVVVLLVGAPSREVVQRSLEPRSRADRAPRPPEPAGAGGPIRSAVRTRPDTARPAPPAAGAPPRPGSSPTPTLVAPTPTDARPPVAGVPHPARAGAAPRFQLVRRLGAGGFGRVWLAYDSRLGQEVALKAAHAPDAETEQRIQREARALAAIRHPNCVRIHDLLPATSDPGLAELDGLVIVMEHVDGEPLGGLVRNRGPLDDVAAAWVWAGVAGALHAAHTLGVMHRDVKPGNIVLDRAGLAHLIDFGIARATTDATMTIAGFVLGTPDYLAPEVASGERATPASDSWQLAATISFALTGHPPRGSRPDAMSGLRAAATGAPLSHLPTYSAHTALLRAALDNDPSRRPPLPVAQRALHDWLARVGARPDGPVRPAVHGGR
ncbi:MAG TPA: serine/threonine-protein kinase [Pseudonocardia sp.]|nr:serine/threonine-protein kinase [Pseudonocardia sp.]